MEPVDITLNKGKYRSSKPRGGHKSSSANSGVPKKKVTLAKGEREEAQRITAANKPAMLLGADGKIHWIRPPHPYGKQ